MKKHIAFATILANFLDNSINLGGLRFGFAALISLIPVIGDIIDAFLALYLVWIALKIKVPQRKLLLMFWNIGFNFVIGLLPIAGDLIYFIRKANLKNLKIIKQYADRDIIEGEIVE